MVVAEVPVGTQLGKYRITGRLGQGGMGVVYAGEDTRLRRPVAIKLLGENIAREAEILKRFLLEARAAARLNHPNVVTIHDVGQRGSVFYIVMELVGGGSAQARLDAQGALPWREATCIVADICRGLRAAHAAGLIHRDVKPANILLAADGTAKLADFGLTKAPTLVRNGLTQLGTVIGTPHYMSPEHCADEPLDERTDLYSLGATYYTLLVGRVPFDGPDPAMILYSHCSALVPDPRATVPALPQGCTRIVARAMAKARSERYASADDMLGDLLALSAAVAKAPTHTALMEPVTMRLRPARLPETGPAPSWKRRRTALAIGGAGMVLASVCLVLGIGFFGARPTPSTGAEETNSLHPAFAMGQADKAVVLRPRPAPLAGHRGEVKAVSIGGERLASAGADGMVRIWALPSGALLHAAHNPAALEAVALTPDGQVAAAGGQLKAVFLWDAVTGNGLGTVGNFPSNITALAFAPSGKQLAIASETDLQLCDYEPPAKVFRRFRLLQQQYMVTALAFARDGKRLAACNGDGNVYVWDIPSHKRTTAPGTYPGRLTAVALSDDGGRVVFGNHQGVVHLWEPDRASAPTVWSDQERRIASSIFVPDSNVFVFGGEWGGPLRLGDLAAGKTIRIPTGVNGVLNGLCFAPDGRTLAAACSDGTVRLWDVTRADRRK